MSFIDIPVLAHRRRAQSSPRYLKACAAAGQGAALQKLAFH